MLFNFDVYDALNDSDDSDNEINSSELSNTSINTINYNSNKYYIVIPEIYNSNLHGSLNINGNVINLNSYFIILQSFDYINNYNNDLEQFFKSINSTVNNYRKYSIYAIENVRMNLNHVFIRNYKNIISNINYIRPEITQCFILPCGERICVIKTIWLKIIQRTWKKIYKLKQNIWNERKQLRSIILWQTTKKWPNNCRIMPTLRGMLSKLK